MPAQLLLLNPSKPRKKLRRNPAPTPAQMAARKRFAAMARSGAFKSNPSKAKAYKPHKARKNPSKKASSKFASTPFGRRILALRAKRKNPAGDEVMAAVAQEEKRQQRIAGFQRAKKESAVAKKTKKKATAKKAPKRKAKKAAAKKAPKRTKKRSSKKAKAKAPKRRARRASKKSIAKAVRKHNRRAASANLRAKARGLRKRAKRAKGTARSILMARAKAVSLQARAARKHKRGSKLFLSATQRRALKAHGLVKVNPSIMSIVKDMGVLLPVAGVAVAGLALAAIVGGKAVSAARAKMPNQTILANPHAPAVASALVGVVGYIAARMIGSRPGKAAEMVNKMAPALFVGGVAAAAVHTMSAVRVAAPAGAAAASPVADGKISLGARLGLPIGEYVVGEYVVGAWQNAIDVDGTRVALNGAGVFGGRTLGDYVPYDVSEDGPREGARGRRLEARAADIVDDIDAHGGKLPVDGSLSGSVFDSED